MSLVLAFTTAAKASHFVLCGIEAEILSVKNLEKLNGTIIVSRMPDLPSQYDQLMTLKISKAESLGAREGCHLKVNSTVTLQVAEKELGLYSEGKTLKLIYSNQGDRGGSFVTWEIDRPVEPSKN